MENKIQSIKPVFKVTIFLVFAFKVMIFIRLGDKLSVK